MTEAVYRDLGSIVPGPQRTEPSLGNPPPTQVASSPAVLGDAPDGRAPLNLLAEFIAHAGTQTPCTIGLLGGAGSGKSFALSRLLARVGRITGAAARGGDGPFLARIAIHRIEAASLEGDATTALAAALHEQLAATVPDLSREAAHAVQDPQLVARDAAERHDAAQRRLDGERRGLDELDGRRARLAETILYETPGSQVDAYARANRARIENALTGFGIGGDQIRSYKDLVRALAEAGGPGGRTSLAARAFWSFKGQFRLLVTAVILVALGVALGLVIEDRSSWLTWLRSLSDSMLPVAAWMETHVPWLSVLQKLAFAGAALAVLVNVWRGLRFLQPVFRGYSLLGGDLASRRRDLDAGFAHQTRRVDVLTAEAEAAAKRAADAERRAGSSGAHSAPSEPAPFDTAGGWTRARDYVAAVDRQIDGARAAPAGTSSALPQRIVVALDDLEAVSPARAKEILDAGSRLTGAARNYILVAALDPRAAGETDEARRALDKWIGVPFRVTEDGEPGGYGDMVRAVLGHATPAKAEAPVDATKSLLDQPVPGGEIDLLSALGPVAGGSPRAVKRFATLFRIARLANGVEPAPLALMLALDAGGTSDEIVALRAALSRADAGGTLDLGSISPRLRQVEATVPGFRGAISRNAASRAAAIARTFSLRG